MQTTITLQEQTSELLAQGKYSQISSLYEQIVAAEPNVISHYWYLGLAYLLEGHEEEAQTTWMLALADTDPEEI